MSAKSRNQEFNNLFGREICSDISKTIYTCVLFSHVSLGVYCLEIHRLLSNYL